MPPLSELQQPKHQPGTIFALVFNMKQDKAGSRLTQGGHPPAWISMVQK